MHLRSMSLDAVTFGFMLGLISGIALCHAGHAGAEELGSVNTEWKLIGSDHRIVVEAFDDPKVPGATCYVSRSKKGGIKGAIGIADETSDASIACRQTGPITLVLPGPINAKGEDVFTESRSSALFKKLHVTRFWDPERRVLVYLSYTDELVNGSPKSSLSVIPVMR